MSEEVAPRQGQLFTASGNLTIEDTHTFLQHRGDTHVYKQHTYPCTQITYTLASARWGLQRHRAAEEVARLPGEWNRAVVSLQLERTTPEPPDNPHIIRVTVKEPIKMHTC